MNVAVTQPVPVNGLDESKWANFHTLRKTAASLAQIAAEDMTFQPLDNDYLTYIEDVVHACFLYRKNVNEIEDFVLDVSSDPISDGSFVGQVYVRFGIKFDKKYTNGISCFHYSKLTITVTSL